LKKSVREDIFARTYFVEAELYNDQDRCIGKTVFNCKVSPGFSGLNYLYFLLPWFLNPFLIRDNYHFIEQGVFLDDYSIAMIFSVKAEDLTDNMTIRIANIEERSSYSSGGIFRSGPDIIPVSVMR
jgi:hypothetical protein